MGDLCKNGQESSEDSIEVKSALYKDIQLEYTKVINHLKTQSNTKG